MTDVSHVRMKQVGKDKYCQNGNRKRMGRSQEISSRLPESTTQFHTTKVFND